MNGTIYEERYEFYYWRMQSITCLITAWILVSNILTLVTIQRTAALKEKSMYKLVACLAAVDLSAGLLFILHLLLIGINLRDFKITFVGCQMIMTAAIFPMYNTILHQLFLVIDRYIAVSYPLRHKDFMTEKLVKILVASSWAFSFTVSLAGFLFPSDVGMCKNLSSISASYFYGFLYVPYMLTMPVMFGLHGLIWRTARKTAREINVEMERTTVQRQAQLSMVSETKATKICLVTMVIFFLSTFPFFHIVIALYIVEKGSELERITQLLFTISWTVLYSNSGANIFVYALKSQEFRKSISGLLKTCFRRGADN